MKPVALVGVLLLVLGLFAFVVPIPDRENHGVKIGDTKIAVQTENSEKLPPGCRCCSSRWGCPCPGAWITQDLGTIAMGKLLKRAFPDGLSFRRSSYASLLQAPLRP
jgi:hypothetical protein